MTIGLMTIGNTLLQLLTFKCTMVIDNILKTIPIVNFCMPYCNCQLFYGTTTFVRTIATEDYCMLQISINNVSYIDCNYAYKLITAL